MVVFKSFEQSFISNRQENFVKVESGYFANIHRLQSLPGRKEPLYSRVIAGDTWLAVETVSGGDVVDVESTSMS